MYIRKVYSATGNVNQGNSHTPFCLLYWPKNILIYKNSWDKLCNVEINQPGQSKNYRNILEKNTKSWLVPTPIDLKVKADNAAI
jgi:hypothetical protein